MALKFIALGMHPESGLVISDIRDRNLVAGEIQRLLSFVIAT
ncbi:hypothetical protein [Acaryochloris sp. CCMEE 5410]|nr:hypothetical protein [Acaryochloris sp. CCMEE 5410]